MYFYCPNLVKQFSGVKTKEQQCRMGVGSVLGPDASEPVAVLWGGGGGGREGGASLLVERFNRRMAPLQARPSAATA